MTEKQDVVVPVKDDYNGKSNLSETTVALSEYLKESVKNILNNVTDEKFVQIYKTCYKVFEKKDDIARPSLAGSSVEGKKYRSKLNEIVLKSISEIIDETVATMDEKLKELDELKKEQSDSTVQWRPPGNASQHMVPFEYVCEKEKKKELEGKIEREQEAVSILKTRLLQKRKKAKELHQELLSHIDEIKRVATQEVSNQVP